MGKPKMTLPDWMAEAYTRYLTETPKKKKKKTLEEILEEWINKNKSSFERYLEKQKETT